MIYTVTFNPSIDYLVSVEEFRLGYTNRTSTERILPGGKGINLSIVLKHLGLENTALGFVAGFTGDEIVCRLKNMGISEDFIRLQDGMSRINLKLLSVEGTEINGSGPAIDATSVELLWQKLESLQQGDILFLAGSIPASMASDSYQQIMEKLQGRGICTVVDATGDLLKNVLQYQPFLIKPNKQELEELTGVTIVKSKDVISMGKKLQEMGARNVLVSLGAEGAILLAENGMILEEKAPKGIVKNSVGAGDSMLAGFMAGWLEKQDYEYAFHMGLAAGSASAFSENLATKDEILHLLNNTNFSHK